MSQTGLGAKRPAPQQKQPGPIAAPAVDRLLEFQRLAEQRAAAYRQARERKRLRPGNPPWTIGRGGIGD